MDASFPHETLVTGMGTWNNLWETGATHGCSPKTEVTVGVRPHSFPDLASALLPTSVALTKLLWLSELHFSTRKGPLGSDTQTHCSSSLSSSLPRRPQPLQWASTRTIWSTSPLRVCGCPGAPRSQGKGRRSSFPSKEAQLPGVSMYTTPVTLPQPVPEHAACSLGDLGNTRSFT